MGCPLVRSVHDKAPGSSSAFNPFMHTHCHRNWPLGLSRSSLSEPILYPEINDKKAHSWHSQPESQPGTLSDCDRQPLLVQHNGSRHASSAARVLQGSFKAESFMLQEGLGQEILRGELGASGEVVCILPRSASVQVSTVSITRRAASTLDGSAWTREFKMQTADAGDRSSSSSHTAPKVLSIPRDGSYSEPELTQPTLRCKRQAGAIVLTTPTSPRTWNLRARPQNHCSRRLAPHASWWLLCRWRRGSSSSPWSRADH
eukprot:2797162-Rhodomonas_salina.1